MGETKKCFSPLVVSDSFRPHAVACQAPLSMGFPKQEYWSGVAILSPGGLPTQGSILGLLQCMQILYHLSHQENYSQFSFSND